MKQLYKIEGKDTKLQAIDEAQDSDSEEDLEMEDEELLLKCIVRSVIWTETNNYVKALAKIGLFLYSKILRRKFLRKKMAAIKIQSLFKMYPHKKVYKVKLRRYKEEQVKK